jgi:MoxR-like ATPase
MTQDFSRFSGTPSYITSPELRHAVNVALAIERPLLVRGEPGTGKTLLARAGSSC